jgi:AcrR family transcriptional regulator
MSPTHESVVARPRVEGDREAQILAATLDVLVDEGYDRLTMDAVAARAKASKATLYRRWNTKLRLVMDALHTTKEPPTQIDTGSLRGDLQQLFCGMGSVVDPQAVAVFGSVITAVARDEEFAETYRREFIGPRIAVSKQVWQRAVERGELRDHVDLALLEPALAGIVLHRVFVMGEQPSEDLVTRVIDQIILPAATRAAMSDHSPVLTTKETS